MWLAHRACLRAGQLRLQFPAGRRRTTPRANVARRSPTDEIVTALDEQTVVVTGTNAAALVIPRLAAQLATLRKQRDEVAAEVERLVDAHPLQPVLTSMPRSRRQDRSQTPHGSRRQTIPHRGTPRRLRRPRSRHPKIRVINPRRILITPRKQDPQEHHVPPRSPHSATPTHAPTTTARSARASATTRRCSLSPDAAPTCSTRCSATAPSTPRERDVSS